MTVCGFAAGNFNSRSSSCWIAPLSFATENLDGHTRSMLWMVVIVGQKAFLWSWQEEDSKAGYVHVNTDPEGKNDGPENPIRVSDIHITVLHQLGIAHDKEVMTPIGRPMRLSVGNVIKSLLKST